MIFALLCSVYLGRSVVAWIKAARLLKMSHDEHAEDGPAHAGEECSEAQEQGKSVTVNHG